MSRHPTPQAMRRKPLPRFALRPTAVAVHLLLAGVAVGGWVGTAQAQTAAAASTRSYNIPAGPLNVVLTRFLSESGVLLSGSTELAQGKQSPGVQGSLTPDAALAALLAGTGLQAVPDAQGRYVLRVAPVVTRRGEAQLATVTVTADAERESAWGPVKGYVAKRSATGTKTDTPIIETPQSISVVGRDEIEARGVSDSRGALLYTPGILVDPWGMDDRMNNGETNVMFRGFDQQGLAYLDGLKLPQGSSSWSFPRTEVYGIERVEILRGPASVMFGQGDVGGIINRVSKLPQREAVREVQVQIGSDARRKLGFDVGAAANDDGTLLWRLVGVSQEQDTQVQYPGYSTLGVERQYIAPSLSWQATPKMSITLLGSYLHQKGPGNSPEYVDDQGKRTGILVDEPSYSHYETTQWDLGYQFYYLFDSGWKLQQRLRTSSISLPDHTTLSSYNRADASGNLARNNAFVDETMRYTVIDTQLHGLVNTAGIEHKLLFGVDWLRDKSSVLNIYAATAPSLNINSPAYGLGVVRPTLADAFFAYDYAEVRQQLGAYLQDQINFGSGWLLTLAGRQDWAKSEQDNHLTSTTTKTDEKAFTGRVGLSYQTTFGLAPYASYAESFLPTAGFDPSGEPFKPTRGKQYEIGVKYQPAGSQALLTAAVYELTKTNVLTYDPTTWVGEQRGEIRSRGLELEAKASLARGVNLTAQYTLNDIAITRDSDQSLIGKRPMNAPKYMASAWIDYTVQGGDWAGVGIGTGARYIGARYGDAANMVKIDGVTVFDAAVHYTRGPWRFALNAQNLSDKETGTYSSGVFWPGLKRAVTASASYRF